MRRHGFLIASVLTALAGLAWLLHHHDALDAAEEQGARSFRQALSGSPDPDAKGAAETGIRLNFFDAPWERVLKNVADQRNLTLVMEDIPPGRFARRDRRYHEPDAAIRILNAELEPLGYRLLLQNEFLIVLDLDKARTEYARPRMDVRTPEGRTSGRTAPIHSAGFTADLERTADGGPRSDEADDEGSPISREPAMTAAEPAMTAAGFVTRSFSCRHNKAADLARTIYLVFENRAELQREGIRGLPSFAVFDADTNGKADHGEAARPRTAIFRIGIDQAGNELVIEAPSAKITHLATLIAELDKPMVLPDAAVKLVPNHSLAGQTANALNREIQHLVALQRDAPPTSGDDHPTSLPDQPADAQAGPPAAGTPEAPTPDGAGGSLNLRGEVNVQAMQDLGILILKGNEADVEKVAEIIARLETMSVGSLPDIHVLSLTSVNSEALAVLLTSVYDRLSELRQRGTTVRKTAAFIPVVQPNAILILAPAGELESILSLAEKLDQPLNPEFEFRAFPLRNAIASQVVTSLESFYEERGGLGTRVRVVADVRTNTVIVQGRTRDLTEVDSLIQKIDRDDSGAVHRVQIFPLQNAVAEELSNTISAAIQNVTNPPQQTAGQFGGFAGLGGTQGAQELRASKSVALEFLTTDGNARQLIRSGILVDVRVSADVRSNSLIVSAPEASMALMSALIVELDRAPGAVAEIKVFTLKNADAERSVTLLQSLFENQNQEDQLGIQIAGTEDAASSLIPLRFSADIRTNTVLAVGGAEALGVAEAILLRLDTADVRERQTEVIPLRNAEAARVSESVNQFLTQQAALQDSSEDLISNIERLRLEVIVAEDVNSNSLIVSASPQYFSKIRQVIEALDAKPPEVVIQALIVEVTLDETDEFGIELGFQDPLLLSRSLTSTTTGGVTSITGTGTPGLNFNNSSVPLGNNALTANPGIVGTQGLSNFSLGRQNTDLGFGGFVFSAQSDAVSVLLRALAARRTVHVLSRPQIRTTHNNLALVTVGQDVPLVDGVTVNQFGTANPNVVRENTGITLEVTPRITPDGTVALSVYASKSALAATGVPIFINADGSTIESPIINQSVADTVVNVPNGQTIVIGGMITKSDSSLERKVPWLGDLPIVGRAFRYDGTTTTRTELLIFLTPRIVLSDYDSELIKQIEAERLHFIESEAEEIHGPLYSVPSTDPACQVIPEQSGIPIFPSPESAPSLSPVVPPSPAQPLTPRPAGDPAADAGDAQP